MSAFPLWAGERGGSAYVLGGAEGECRILRHLGTARVAAEAYGRGRHGRALNPTAQGQPPIAPGAAV